MGEPFIISIDNTNKAVTVIEFFPDGNLKCVTHSNAFNATAINSSSFSEINKTNFKIFELCENKDEDALIEQETKLTTAIAGVRHFDNKNVIIEQSPKYMFSNGLFYSPFKLDTEFAVLNQSANIVAYIPWHLIHLKNINSDQIEVDVYLSDKKLTSLNEEIYVNTLVNKSLFKIPYATNFFDDTHGTFAYGLHNDIFRFCITKVLEELAAVTQQLGITSQQDFINYNKNFVNKQSDLNFIVKTTLENVIEQNKIYDQEDIVSCNQDMLDLFKNKILDNPKICTGHEALHFLLNAQVINLDNNTYKLVSVWKNFEYIVDNNCESIFYPELSTELMEEVNHHYLSNLDSLSLVNNYIVYNQQTTDNPVIEDSISFEDVNNFFVDIEQNMNSYHNTSLESL